MKLHLGDHECEQKSKIERSAEAELRDQKLFMRLQRHEVLKFSDTEQEPWHKADPSRIIRACAVSRLIFLCLHHTQQRVLEATNANEQVAYRISSE